MLQHIHIENYTLIDTLSIDLYKGFTAITGETGAGKSMFVGAINFLMGQKVDASVMRDKTKKTIVEAVFKLENDDLQPLFESLNLDYDEECIVRREINLQGKSRSFVNDTPVNAADLKKITLQLVDIHAQHSNILLQNKDFQLSLIDQYAQLDDDIRQFRQTYMKWKELKNTFSDMQAYMNNNDINDIECQLKELEEAHLVEGEQRQIEEQLKTLQHSQEIQQVVGESLNLLDMSEMNVLQMMREVKQKLSGIASFSETYQHLEDRINSQIIELEDVVYELNHLFDNISNPNQEIDQLTQRLNLLNRLERQNNVQTEAELIALVKTLQEKKNAMLDYVYECQQVQQQLDEKEQLIQQLGRQLTKKRTAVLPQIETALKQQLRQMNMPDVEVSIQLMQDELTATGFDVPSFLFNVNKGMQMQEISKIASGGEISRLMLALKSLIISKNVLSTIIFDEIDTGISGSVSSKMGEVMKNIAKNCQVITITHLPQISAKAEHHYLIYKQTQGNTTEMQIKLLDRQERIGELAKMISNENVTDAALKTAENLLNG
ncbi:MAG: DNA repair protein RecN [Bacteroidales bacterium]|nr:DNA repair protein RecN [Bacteroidales bacterium]